jgi:cytoskeletal protein RodZ
MTNETEGPAPEEAVADNVENTAVTTVASTTDAPAEEPAANDDAEGQTLAPVASAGESTVIARVEIVKDAAGAFHVLPFCEIDCASLSFDNLTDAVYEATAFLNARLS